MSQKLEDGKQEALRVHFSGSVSFIKSRKGMDSLCDNIWTLEEAAVRTWELEHGKRSGVDDTDSSEWTPSLCTVTHMQSCLDLHIYENNFI